jgi:O-methyltransferase
MAILLRLRQRGISDRDVVGFDRFTGEFTPAREDVDFKGRAAGTTFNKLAFEIGTRIAHLEVSRDEVFALLASTGYAPERIHL